jgi:crotonobetainyl-CoA:carnitine CoA-transferase CaiB-like acyl-CoA transferase/enoyl-CoA hydratase/carnithine racemase
MLIQIHERDGVVWLGVHEPVRLGPDADRLAWELIDFCVALGERDRPPNAVVLRSKGGAFWVLPPQTAAECDAAAGPWAEAMAVVAALEPPTIAVMEGDALGPAWELALACDLRIASTDARVGSPEIHFARMPTAGGTQRLTRLARESAALELLLLGEPLDANRALELGLVQLVAEPADLDEAVERLVGSLRTAGPIALALAKEAIHRGLDLTLSEGLILELDLSALLQTTADRTDGIAAFKERRGGRLGGGRGAAARPLERLRVRNLGRGRVTEACVRLLEQLGAAAKPGSALPTEPGSQLVLLDEQSLLPWPSAAALHQQLPPGCVAVAITPFGLSGSPGDEDLEAAAGWLGPTVGTALAATHAMVAGLAALRWAQRQRVGLVVDVAIVEMSAICLGDALPRAICPRAQRDGQDTGARMSRTTVLACRDGFVAISGLTQVHRSHLAALTGIESVLDERRDLATTLEPWSQSHTRAELFEIAQLWRLPLVPVLNLEEAQEQALHGASPFQMRDVVSAIDGIGAIASPPGPGDSLRAPHPLLQPLSDVRVLDLGAVWAGPYAARLLAVLGAQVVKVEAPTRPDGTRPPDAASCAGAFGDLNRGKQDLALDLSQPEGRQAFLRLVSRSDVVVENFSRRVMPNFGLDYGTMAATHPGLLHVSMPAFPSESPWADAVAYGGGLELMAGLGMRPAGGRPGAAPVPYLDYLSGAYGALAVLAWLFERDRSGVGAHVEVAQWEVARSLLADRSGQPGAAFAPDPVAIAADPQLAARGFVTSVESEEAFCHHYARAPWLIHGLPPAPERPAPAFGADTREVLVEWGGMSEAEAEDLEKRGITQPALVEIPPRMDQS